MEVLSHAGEGCSKQRANELLCSGQAAKPGLITKPLVTCCCCKINEAEHGERAETLFFPFASLGCEARKPQDKAKGALTKGILCKRKTFPTERLLWVLPKKKIAGLSNEMLRKNPRLQGQELCAGASHSPTARSSSRRGRLTPREDRHSPNKSLQLRRQRESPVHDWFHAHLRYKKIPCQ